MKWLKNKEFLLLFIVIGVAYLSFVDGWQIYAAPLAEVRTWYQRVAQGQLVVSDSVVGQDDPDAPENRADEGKDGEGALREGEAEIASGEETAPVAGEGEDLSGAGAAVGGSTVSDGDAGFGKDGGAENGSDLVYMAVEDDYFADAVFIGDSRTVGLYEYGGLEEITTFYASKGLTVYKLFSSEVVPMPGQKKKKSIEEALQENQFKKIYLMVGINEMGTGTVEYFAESYGEVVTHLLELQPDAVIYIQGIIKVTTERSEKGDYINNEGIEARNQAIAQLADNERVFFLDVNPLLCDDTGGMEPSYTFDGVHLKAQYIDIWKEYLKSHAVNLE